MDFVFGLSGNGTLDRAAGIIADDICPAVRSRVRPC
jgi:hypothetical protein